MSTVASLPAALPQDRLPDRLRAGLDVVFVGTAAGRYSAAVGAYYARPGNKFWKTLHRVGLTARPYEPWEFGELLPLGIGFTDMSKVGVGMDRDVTPDQYDVGLFEAKMLQYMPRAIAFTSKKAASVLLGMRTGQICLGRLEHAKPDFPTVFVLPSPSGAAGRYWSEQPWRELADWLMMGRDS